MALTHTSEECINRAAAILGKFVPGEALGAVEHDTLSRCIDDVAAELQKVVVIDREMIPNVYFETFSRLVSVYAAADFSNAPPPTAAIEALEARLRYLVAQTPTYEVLVTNYF
jgi:hypothetical protein